MTLDTDHKNFFSSVWLLMCIFKALPNQTTWDPNHMQKVFLKYGFLCVSSRKYFFLQYGFLCASSKHYQTKQLGTLITCKRVFLKYGFLCVFSKGCTQSKELPCAVSFIFWTPPLVLNNFLKNIYYRVGICEPWSGF